MIKQKKDENAKNHLTKEVLDFLPEQEKLSLLRVIAREITAHPEQNYRKLHDLLLCCEDSSFEVVVKAVSSLGFVFKDILPTYRIRELGGSDAQSEANKKVGHDEEGGPALSKEVRKIRDFEQTLLKCYVRFLEILDVFSMVRSPTTHATGSDKKSKSEGKSTSPEVDKQSIQNKALRKVAVEALCTFLLSLSHFNRREVVLEQVSKKLYSADNEIRSLCTNAFKELIVSQDNTLLPFKLEALRRLGKLLKTKQHSRFSPNLLDCLHLQKIVVNEETVRAFDGASSKAEELRAELKRKKKKR